MSFAELKLSESILKAIAACGYTEPTPIQARAIPEALLGRDLIASAQTGTGKTAAFMLPALERLATLKKGPKGAPRILVLTPTRELASQVTEATRTYGRFLRIRSAVILGGSSYREQFHRITSYNVCYTKLLREDQDFHPVQGDGAPVEVVDQASRRRHNEFQGLGQGLKLLPVGAAAQDDGAIV